MKTTLSSCRRYRDLLVRDIQTLIPGERGAVNYIMLNPSTADERNDDPTIARLVRRCELGGFRQLIVTNLFAWRATDPSALKTVPDPVGPVNDGYILDAAKHSEIVVCAWGNHGSLDGRARAVLNLLSKRGFRPHYLRVTGNGQPEHPLYVPYDEAPKPWEATTQ